MNSWELNKIAAAVLSALLIIFGAKTAIEISQTSYGNAKIGYALPVKEAAVTATAAAPAAGGELSFAKVAELLPKGSVEGGQGVFKKCAACHTPEKGGANRVGPNMWGVVERAKASIAGFGYSEAAKSNANDKWTWQNLTGFLINPKGYMPGTKMVFAGITDPAELADLLAYLRTLSDAPAALPK